ncbi:MAG TPA: hypothetical protein VHR41_18435 [Gemmatimonadales bacterium]|jgi:hypothetical protein|nr:hypothetical protein [Gemmatimonadales bacterium]
MTLPTKARWPYRPALLLAAVALLLAMAAMLSALWLSSLLFVAAVAFALVAVLHFWRKWLWQRANRPE